MKQENRKKEKKEKREMKRTKDKLIEISVGLPSYGIFEVWDKLLSEAAYRSDDIEDEIEDIVNKLHRLYSKLMEPYNEFYKVREDMMNSLQEKLIEYIREERDTIAKAMHRYNKDILLRKIPKGLEVIESYKYLMKKEFPFWDKKVLEDFVDTLNELHKTIYKYG